MEVIVLIAIIWAIASFLGSLAGDSASSPATATRPSSRTPGRSAAPKAVRARTRLIDVEYEGGRKWKSIQVGIKGAITVPRDGYEVKWGLRILDVTGSEPELVASLHPEFTDGERPWLMWTNESFSTIPYRESVISDWMEFPPIPVEIVHPPYSGSRKIKCFVTGTGRDGEIAVSVADTLQITFAQPGYVEEREQGQKDEKELEASESKQRVSSDKTATF